MNTFTKQSTELLDYKLDFSEWLAGGDTISSTDETIPDGLTLDKKVTDSTMVTLFIKGGTDGETYKVTSKVTTTSGLIKEVDFQIKVKDT